MAGQLQGTSEIEARCSNTPDEGSVSDTLSIHDTLTTPQPPNDHARRSHESESSSRTRHSPNSISGLAARFRALGRRSSNHRQKSKDPAPYILTAGHNSDDQISNGGVPERSHSAVSLSSSSSVVVTSGPGRAQPQIVGDCTTGFKASDGTAELADTNLGDSRLLCEVEHAVPWSMAVAESFDMVEQEKHLEMDSNKYRLPEHLNGNGTKAMPETRKAHIERVASFGTEDNPPPPISKDSPSGGTPAETLLGEAPSYFNTFGLQRTNSIYTISRASFASQLAQLTSLQRPDVESLSVRVAAIPTSQAATRALMGAAEQIRSWIAKANDVLSGLGADDDVEWAAAGGREGLAEVDGAIMRFEELVNVYVTAIEDLQDRDDIGNVRAPELTTVAAQVESILNAWNTIRDNMNGIKVQVEIAMEWEELWNVVLGDIGNEVASLRKLVFEMEERRHKSLLDGNGGVDLSELETIVEETPAMKGRSTANNRFSVNVGFPMSPSSPNTSAMTQDDSTLLALFARMQPLRASLDFLPMRLSSFDARAIDSFRTACEELETRRTVLEADWKMLEKDAEILRRELGEDRWILVFRGAGRQAQKMYESVERSIAKLRDAFANGGHLDNPVATSKKVENYETKKMHYGPAIERVLAIIEKGVHDRLTVNGEIVRLLSDLQKRWIDIKAEMYEVDAALQETQSEKQGPQLRDSVSSLMSNDRSTIASLNETPGSSPASSVIMSTRLELGSNWRKGRSSLPTPRGKSILSSVGSSPSSQLPRTAPSSQLSSCGTYAAPASSMSSARGGSATPTESKTMKPSISSDGKPRWNSSVKAKAEPLGMTFNALQLTTPSPHAKKGPPSAHSNRSALASSAAGRDSKIPLRSPVASGPFSSPVTDVTPSKPPITSRSTFRDRVASPGPYSQQVLSTPSQRPKPLHSQTTSPQLKSGIASSRTVGATGSSPLAQSSNSTRPASSLALNRRVNAVSQSQAQAKGRKDSSVTGRESPQAIAGAASAMRAISRASTSGRDIDKPKWR